MDKNTACLRVLLTKNQAGRVGYCESCDVVELEIGAVSLRIDAKDLHCLADLFKEANDRLKCYRLAKEQERMQAVVTIGRIH